jgi:tetratricopeptide (TPR) repeat protein
MTAIRLPRPRRLRATTYLAAALAIAGATYLAGALANAPSSTTSSRPQPAAVLAPSAPVPASGGTDALLRAIDHEIGLWTASLRANPGDFIAATMVGSLHERRARITGDLADYQVALEAADRGIEADPIHWPAHVLRASVLFSLHDFPAALDEARRTYDADDTQLQALAVMGDASLELGDVEAADDAYSLLAQRAASPPVWSRLAHLAFITGDADRAAELARRAIAESGDEPAESQAFYRYQVGELHRAAGRLGEAEAAYREALQILEGHIPASAGLGRVLEAKGDRAGAIELLERATLRLPQPELVAALGDLHALAGDHDRAEQQYALVERIAELARATGTAYDRQLVLFAADHDRGVADAVAMATAELEARPDVYGYDALAWALYRDGQLERAAHAAGQAMRLGTPDPRLAYHAGMIAAAQGRSADALMLLRQASEGAAYLPPLQAVELQRALADLTGETDR